jgi:hypothetical protein
MAWSGCYSEREGKRRRKEPRAITAREGGPSWPGGWKAVAAARWICVRALANRLVLVRPRSEALQCRVGFGGGSWCACGGGCWVLLLAAAGSARRGMARRCSSWQPCRGREGGGGSCMVIRTSTRGRVSSGGAPVSIECAARNGRRRPCCCSLLGAGRSKERKAPGRPLDSNPKGNGFPSPMPSWAPPRREREEHPAHIAQRQASGPYRSSPKEAETDHPPPPPQWAGRRETAAREAARASLQGGGRGGDSRTSRSGGHVAAAAVSPTPAPAAADGGAVPFPVGERRAGMLLRVRAGGEEGKDGALAGLLTSFFWLLIPLYSLSVCHLR